LPAPGVAPGAVPGAGPGAAVAGGNVSSMGSDTVAGGATVTALPGGSQPVSSGGLSVPASQRLAAMAGVAEVPSARPTAEPDGPAPKITTSITGPGEVKVGDEFSVALQVDSDQPVKRARAQMRWDGAAFQLLGGDPGSAVPASSQAKVIGRTGGAQLDFNSPDDPIPGGGELIVLKFKALQARPATAFAAQLSVLGNSGTIVASSTPAPLSVAVTN
jgi:hypothetical protein